MTADKKQVSGLKLTDAERHARFLEAAKRAEASDDPADFERAFRAVTKNPPKKTPKISDDDAKR